MSTWAARVAKTGGRVSSTSQDFGNQEASHYPSTDLNQPSRCRSGSVSQESSAIAQALQRRAYAEIHNSSHPSARLLRIPPDCWDWVTAFMTYADVIHLGGTCKQLWAGMHERNTIWIQQLQFFRDDVKDMRGGELLCTDFLVPRNIPFSDYDRFRAERRAYVLDAKREWFFRDTSQEIEETTLVTVPLRLGAACNLTHRPALRSSPSDEQERRDPTTLSPTGVSVGSAQTRGQSVRLCIWRPAREAVNTKETYSYAQSVFDDEDEALQYALAVSSAEAEGRPPPVLPTPSRCTHLGSPPCVREEDVTLFTPSELMTLADVMNFDTTMQSRISLHNVTQEEDYAFYCAFAETLLSAMHSPMRPANNQGGHTHSRQVERWPSSESAMRNSLLVGFSGQLLEITMSEAYRVCSTLIGKPKLLDSFVVFHGSLARHVERSIQIGSMPFGISHGRTRFFLAPELCRHKHIGLVVVDAVRVLIVVEEEATVRDDPSWAVPVRLVGNGRVVIPGQGCNAQLYRVV